MPPRKGGIADNKIIATGTKTKLLDRREALRKHESESIECVSAIIKIVTGYEHFTVIAQRRQCLEVKIFA
nr:hypothetical protein [Allorhodopirellula solitaria]